MFPAPAGMSPPAVVACSITTDVPRTRGDEPDFANAWSKTVECSPHPRG